MRNVITKLAVSLLIGGLVLVASAPAGAWEVALDFITGGGWFIISPQAIVATPGTRANFGWHGGVKNGDWWGNGNYIDHGNGLHVHSTSVTGYVVAANYPPDKNGHPRGTRDICGTARTQFGDFLYRVRMRDLGEPGRDDAFGIALYSSPGTPPVYLAQGIPINGGNIQLHKGNRSNTAPSTPPSCDSLPDHFTFS